jgi:hypothetical protein
MDDTLPYYTVAIVGSSPETRELAPWDHPDIDIWVFNEAYSQNIRGKDGEPYKWCKRANAVFQLHDQAVYRSEHNRSDRRHWEWLQQEHGDLAVYMKEVDPQVPNSKRLPIEALHGLLDDFRHGTQQEKRSYLTSTVAIALALAIHRAYDCILIYGVEMASDTEYQYQRECVLFWLGVAVGRGIRVVMVSGESMFNRPVYAYEGALELDIDVLRSRSTELNAKIVKALRVVHEAEDNLALWNSKQAGEAITIAGDAQFELGYLEGALYEVERYTFKAEAMRADGIPFIDRNEYEGAAAQANNDLMKLGPLVYRTAGHVDMALNSWLYTRNPAHLEQTKQVASEHIKASYNNGRAKGILDENRRLATEWDKQYKAAGGERAAAALVTENQLSQITGQVASLPQERN